MTLRNWPWGCGLDKCDSGHGLFAE